MKHQILFVDDEIGILNALKRQFRTENFQLHTATSGKEGLNILAEHNIDLIISDMRMPHMDGATFLSEAKSHYPDVIRILLTGYADMDSTIKAINDGAIFGYLSKPWESSQLFGLVENALAQRVQIKNKKIAIDSVLQERDTLKNKVEHQQREMAMADNYINDTTNSLQDNYSRMEEVLLNLLCLKDPKQREICLHVEQVVKQIATQLCMSDSEINLMGTAARLHGIGKIALPDTLLKKPINSYSVEENQQYLQYPAHSACTLMAFKPYQEVSKIITLQKAYLDGSGTLQENNTCELSIYSRILIIAIDYVDLRLGQKTGQKLQHEVAINRLEDRATKYDERLTAILSTVTMGIQEIPEETDIQIPVLSLRKKMILNKSIYNQTGTLLLKKNTLLTETMIDQLQRIQRNTKKSLIVSIRFELTKKQEAAHNTQVIECSQ